ncbi:MAG TPA: hypothetical protein VFS60_16265, partial [Thermoanaerobaculia bacterium]|nr:hypothetical protein [Thermoanaerobaculia bacterium]
MPNSRAVRLLVLVALVFCCVAPVVAAEKAAAGASREPSAARPEELEGYGDPDMPAFMRGRMDEAEYLQLRNEAIAQKRGLPYGTTAFNPRVKAIRDMEAVMASAAHQQSPDISETSWTEIGPNPIPNGQTSGYPGVTHAVSGRTISIAVHPTDPNKVYVGTAQGGLYRSLDGGATWTPLTDGILSLAIGAVAIDPSDTTRVWIGTGECGFSADSFFGVGLYRITNAESVSPTIEGPFNINTALADVMTFRSISRIIIHPTVPNTVFVATGSGVGGLFNVAGNPLPNRGVFRAVDALAVTPHFDRLDVPTGAANVAISDIAMQPGNPDVLLAMATVNCAAFPGSCGIWRSINANAVAPTFTLELAFPSSVSRGEFAVNPAAPTNMLAAIGETPPAGGCTTAANSGVIRRSTDAGDNWGAPVVGGRGFCGGQCFYDIFIAMDPTDATGNKIFLGGAANGTCTRIYALSTDGGATFSGSGVQDIGLHADSHAIAIAPSNPSIVYESSDGGIWKSIDGGLTWSSLNNTTFRATQFMSVAYHPTDPNFSIGGTQDNGTNQYQPAATWNRIDFGDGGFAVIDQNAPDNVNVTMYHTYFNQRNNLVAYARVSSVVAAFDGNWNLIGQGANN